MYKLHLWMLLALILSNAKAQSPFEPYYPYTPIFHYEPYNLYSEPKCENAVMADIDGDGYLDMVKTGGLLFNTIPTYVGIYHGDCTGSFTDVRDTILLADIFVATAVSVKDFNQDQLPDILVAGDGKLALLVNNGIGGFDLPIYTNLTVSIAGVWYYICVGHFNSDTYLDVFVNIAEYDGLSDHESMVYLGNNSGVFTLGQAFIDDVRGRCRTADFNNDGLDDVMAASGSIYLNNGTSLNPTFNQAFLNNYLYTKHFEVANMDADPQLEFVSFQDSLFAFGEIDIINPSQFNTQILPISVKSFGIGDFNLDGSAFDLAVMNQSGMVYRMVNNSGVFSLDTNIGYQIQPTSIITADINNNGTTDLIELDGVKVFRNLNSFSLGNNFSFPLLHNSAAATIADVNGDGFDDVITYSNLLGNRLVLIYGSACGFGSTKIIPAPRYGYQLRSGFINNDTLPDLVLSGNQSDSIYVYLNNGVNGYAAYTPYPALHQNSEIVVDDFNNDGLDDVFMISTSPVIYNICMANANGSGLLLPATANTSATGFNVAGNSPSAGDFNGDGNKDIVICHGNAVGSNMTVMYGDGMGNFPAGSVITHNIGGSINYALPFKLNGGVREGLVATNTLNSLTYYLEQDSLSGIWLNRSGSPMVGGALELGRANFNGDQYADLSFKHTVGSSSAYNYVYATRPDYTQKFIGSFDQPTTQFMDGDIDGNGINDAVYIHSGNIYLYKNLTPPNPLISFQNDTITVTPLRSAAGGASVVSFEWYFNNQMLNGVTSAYYPNPIAGWYDVAITYDNGAYTTARIQILGLAVQSPKENTLSVFPNPAESAITIRSNSPMVSYELKTIAGQVVAIGSLSGLMSANVQLNSLPKGLYLMEVMTMSGVVAKKIIIE